MIKANGYAKYREQSILTAGPGELILMLYDGCIKELKLARLAGEEDSRPDFSRHLVKAQDILAELVSGLNFDYELAQQLYALYDYLLHELMLANIEYDQQRLETATDMLADLRQTWTEVVQQTRQGLQAVAVR